MPQFRWYPSLYYLMVALLAEFTHYSIEPTTVLFLCIGICLCAIACYGFLLEVTENRPISLMCALLVISTPSVWDAYISGGVLSREASLFLFPFCLWSTVRFAKVLYKNGPCTKSYICTVCLLALSLSFHPFFGWPIFLISLFLLFVYLREWKQKIHAIIKVTIPVLLLNAYFYIPYVYSPIPSGAVTILGGPSPNLLLVLPRSANMPGYWTLSLVSLPLTATVLVVSHYLKSLRLREDRYLKALAFLTLSLILFLSIGSFLGIELTLLGIAISILPFCLMAFDAILLTRISVRFPKGVKVVFLATLIVALITSTIATYRITPDQVCGSIGFNNASKTDETNILESLNINCTETMHRVGVSAADGGTGMWWNYKSGVPQTRHYYSQGVLYPHWETWLTASVWGFSERCEETNFLLDWWAVKWILVNTGTQPPGNPSKFLDRPDYYTSLANVSTIHVFLVRDHTSIISATNAPTFLVISEQAAPGGGPYRDILNDIAYSNYNSCSVIPIHGNEYVDDYSLEELSMFDAVFLYGYKYHSRDRAWELLEEYVRGGGDLIIETGYSPDADAPFIPPPSPVNRTTWTNFGMEWHFSCINSSVTDMIDFAAFSPAVNEGAAWGISSSLNESIRGWAWPVLWDSGHPIVVMGEYGKGRVVWCGMNLPWHIAVYKNREESRFLSKMVDWTSRAPEKTRVQVKCDAERVNPEKVVVRVDGAASGILFKEFYFKDWHAFLEKDGRRIRELKICRAGPDFMYIAIPRDSEYPIRIVFEFSRVIEYTGLSVSATALFLLLAYGVAGERLVAPLASVVSKIKEKAKSSIRSIRIRRAERHNSPTWDNLDMRPPIHRVDT